MAQAAYSTLSCFTESSLDEQTQSELQRPDHRHILDVRVHATTYEQATSLVVHWAQREESRYVCITSVHGVIESQDERQFRHIQNEADLVTPDGMPLVWALRRLGVPDATRVYGPNLTLYVAKAAAEYGIPIGLYGGTPTSLKDFADHLCARFPGIQIVCSIAPPFRALTPEEDEAYTQEIVASGARILLVGIGCPKQERWMAAHRTKIPAVMIGVGAAFDFHSGRVAQAPDWVQNAGLEWCFRLAMEPTRLWGRYRRIVPRFIALFAAQLIGERLLSSSRLRSVRR